MILSKADTLRTDLDGLHQHVVKAAVQDAQDDEGKRKDEKRQPDFAGGSVGALLFRADGYPLFFVAFPKENGATVSSQVKIG